MRIAQRIAACWRQILQYTCVFKETLHCGRQRGDDLLGKKGVDTAGIRDQVDRWLIARAHILIERKRNSSDPTAHTCGKLRGGVECDHFAAAFLDQLLYFGGGPLQQSVVEKHRAPLRRESR